MKNYKFHELITEEELNELRNKGVPIRFRGTFRVPLIKDVCDVYHVLCGRKIYTLCVKIKGDDEKWLLH